MLRALLSLRMQNSSACMSRTVRRCTAPGRAASTRSPATEIPAAETSLIQASPFVQAFRIAAVGTVVIAAMNVMPAVDAMAVPQSLALLSAKDGMLVRSGGNRIVAAVRRRPERREDYIREGACRKLALCALRDSFHDGNLSAEDAAMEVRWTRDVLYEAFTALSESGDGRKEILADSPLMQLIEVDAGESVAARSLLARLAELPDEEHES